MHPDSSTAVTVRPRHRRRLTAVALSSAALIGLAVGMGPVLAEDPAPTVRGAVWTGYADLVEQVMPSVVTVTTTRSAGRRFVEGEGGPESPHGFDFEDVPEEMRRFFERFFGEPGAPGGPGFGMPAPRQPMQGAGSGFIIAADGLVVTNNHVVEGADEITVRLHDGSELTAELVGSDPDTDLALLEVEAEDLPAVRFADSDAVRVGDPVVAIGNPFGLGGTVTAGIVSAQGRAIGAGRYDDFLQIDAAINRGNSGGPAFNLDGEVIGINTAIHSPSGGNVGIGFAIPANLALRIIDDLKDDGTVERGWLGVYIQSVDEDLAATLDLDEATGALISNVTTDGPAAEAGLEQGDVVLRFGDTQIGDLRDLTRAVADTPPGETIEVEVWRDGERQTIEAEIGQMPGDERVAALNEDPPGLSGDAPRLGVALADLPAEARARLDLEGEDLGVLVTEVQPGSPAAAKGLRPGDVILEIDQQEMASPDDVANAVQAAGEEGKETVLLLVRRDSQDRFVAVPLQQG